jgi:sulfatase modifying factor 1
MKSQLRTTTFLLLIILPSLTLFPISGFAGGGTAGGKSNFIVRIQNNSTSATTPPTTIIQTVEIGDAGNSPLAIGDSSYGQVSTAYRMGRNEVTIKQYADFLNSVATRPDIYSWGSSIIESLYDSRMATDKNVAGISRSGEGTSSSPYAYQVIGDSARPITYVTWFNAARFANWMHNGSLSTSDLEYGAYFLFGTNSEITGRTEEATWWIPTEDEWFKAAYYKGGGTNAGYYTFPTKSDTLPENSSNTAANQANFLRLGVYSVTQKSSLSSLENYLTPVGSFTSSASAYGTFDQGGNVDEWTESSRVTEYGNSLVTRGGGWSTGGLNNDATPESTALPTDRSSNLGFRLARSATVEGDQTLSGNFEVKIKGASATAAKALGQNQIAQFSVKRGNVTVVATDSANPTLSAEKTFYIGIKRQTYITVNNANGEINITLSPSQF